MMLSRIESLTPAQEARLVEFRQEWLDFGLCCDPADYTRAEDAIAFFYEKLGKPRPVFFHFSSPLMCELGLAALKTLPVNFDQLWGQLEDQLRRQLGDQLRDQLDGQLRDQLDGQLRDQLWGQLWGQLWDQLWDQLEDQLRRQLRNQLWGQLGGQLWDQLGDQLGDQLDGQLGDQLEGQLRDQLDGQLRDQLWGQLWGQLDGQLEGQLRDQLRDQLEGQLEDQLWDQLTKKEFYLNSFGGQHSAAWKAFYLFSHEIGVEFRPQDLEVLKAWGEIAKSIGWWAPFEGVVIMSDRPRKVKFDEQARLHCEDGKSVEFSDGWGVYSWHGVAVPEQWIMDKSSLTAQTALTWENLEQRRAACEIIGWAKILRELNAASIHKDDDPQIGELLEVDIPDVGREKFLRVQCGTGREFALPVPPNMQTALQANAWTYGMDAVDYKPEIRT